MKSKEVTTHKIVFLPEVEFDVIRSLIPKDNIEEYVEFCKQNRNAFSHSFCIAKYDFSS